MSSNQHYKLTINKYDGNLNLVGELAKLIENKYADLFYAVIVHGSVATKEVVPYSDFDGLLIVKDISITSKRLQRFKNESMKLILKFDPLQHHGWFQITESQLLNYSESYLPIVILENAKCVFPKDINLRMDISVKGDIDYKSHLIKMLNQFERRIKTNWEPKNMFQLKSISSQIMLMPSLYYSAINNKGIFKSESFKAVRSNFNDDQWMPIETASTIRRKWNYKLNPIQKFMMQIPHSKARKILRSIFSPKINSEFSLLMDADYYLNLDLLIKKIKSDIQ